MDAFTTDARISPFRPGYRACGLLLHLTSLPSPYGIGDLGSGAFDWVDRLHDAGQTWWQALPFGPTGYGNSPYQCLSSFSGNELWISPDLLIEDGLLKPADCQGAFSSTTIDYDLAIPFKHRLLEVAWTRFRNGVRSDLVPAYEQFCHSRATWLEDYALFRALKARCNGISYLQWPAEFVQRSPSALAEARRSLAGEIDKIRFGHFLLFRQGIRLKEHARAMGVRLIGDLPFSFPPIPATSGPIRSCFFWINSTCPDSSVECHPVTSTNRMAYVGAPEKVAR